MLQNGQFDHLHSLLIDLQYLVADIANELRKPPVAQMDVEPSIFYEAWVVDMATRGLILSIQSVLFDMASEDISGKAAFGQFQ